MDVHSEAVARNKLYPQGPDVTKPLRYRANRRQWPDENMPEPRRRARDGHSAVLARRWFGIDLRRIA